MNVTTEEIVLAAAVASPAGTVTVAYPTGYTQANFIGNYAAATAYLIVDDNDRYEEADDEFDISYGASNATITNKTGSTWPVGTKLRVAFSKADETNYEGPVAAVIADPTGGATTDAEARTAINAIIDALQSAGIVASA